MKNLLILILLPFYSFAQTNTQYLVTKQNDTVFYHGDLIVNHDDISKWQRVTADSVRYSINEIKCIYFNHQLYYNCDGRHLYKQVVAGPINVFALYDRDTMPNRSGDMAKHLFIQQNTSKRPLRYSSHNLIRMMAGNDSLQYHYKQLKARRNGGNAMLVTGISLGMPTLVIGAFGAFFSNVLGYSESKRKFLIATATGAFVGGGLIGGGAALKSKTQLNSLWPVYEYNAIMNTVQK